MSSLERRACRSSAKTRQRGSSIGGGYGCFDGRALIRRGVDYEVGDVQLALENGQLKFDHDANPQLAKELRGYQVPDTYVVQDCIMSLSVTLASAGQAYVRPGRIMGVLEL